MWRADLFEFLLAVAMAALVGAPQGGVQIARLTESLWAAMEWRCVLLLGRSSAAGILLWMLVCGALLGGWLLGRKILMLWSPVLGWLWDTLLLSQTLTGRELDTHARGVVFALLRGDLPEARQRATQITDADTLRLLEADICRASIESVAQGAAEGFIAPLFWAALGGAPAALLCRATHTLNARMNGRDAHHTPMAVVLSQLANILSYAPARLCAVASLLPRGFRYALAVLQESARHPRTNAGWIGASAAWALGVRLGGVEQRGGVPSRVPVFNANAPQPGPQDLLRAVRWFWGIAAFCVLLLACGLWARDRFKPKSIPLPEVPPEVPKPAFITGFEELPGPPPEKLKGQVIFEERAKKTEP